MGFWGSFVVHRGEALLWELLPDVRELRDADLMYDRVGGEWQVSRVWASSGDLPENFLTDLRDGTGAPVLAADILDSDAAYVHAIGVRTPFWDTWLEIDGAIGHVLPPPAPFDDDDNFLGDDWVDPEYEREAAATKERMLAETLTAAAAASAALAWAAEAGLTPAPAAEIETALAEEEQFVEDQFFTVLNRLGIRTRDIPSPPTVTEVLTGLIGRRLRGISEVAHQPVRGERRTHPAAPDLLWRFDDHPAVIACGCRDELDLRIADTAGSASEPAGQILDVALVFEGSYPDVHGVVLRLADREVALRSTGGRWEPNLEGERTRRGGWLADR